MQPIRIVHYTLGPFQENAYLLVGPSGRRAAVVDPGLDSERILEDVARRGITVEMILNTHGHLDHVAGNRRIREATGALLGIHPLDEPWLGRLSEQGVRFGIQVEPCPPADFPLEEDRPVLLDGVEIRVIHTPGHTPGGVCLDLGEAVLVGDTLFRGSVGRTDLPGGSWPDLVDSIRRKLFVLPDATVCHTGHGRETTIGEERRTNPFVSDAASAGSLESP